MFTKATLAAITITFAAANAASAQSFNTLDQQAVDFQRNAEISRPAAMPAGSRKATKYDNLSQQAVDFQMNQEVGRSGATLPADAYASAVSTRIDRHPVAVPQTKDFQLESR